MSWSRKFGDCGMNRCGALARRIGVPAVVRCSLPEPMRGTAQVHAVSQRFVPRHRVPLLGKAVHDDLDRD